MSSFTFPKREDPCDKDSVADMNEGETALAIGCLTPTPEHARCRSQLRRSWSPPETDHRACGPGQSSGNACRRRSVLDPFPDLGRPVLGE